MATKKAASKKKPVVKSPPEPGPMPALDRLQIMTRAQLADLEELLGVGIDEIEEIMTNPGPKVRVASGVEWTARTAGGEDLGTFDEFMGADFEAPDPKG